MPVIIRETRKIAGKKYPKIKVYKSDRLVTKEGIEQAEKLDAYLQNKMEEIINCMIKKDLLKLKNKWGVLKLWYEVGKKLDFIYDPKIVPTEDRKYLWRAIYDHAGELTPGKLDVRAKERPQTSHFRYCCLLAKHDWDFVNYAGNWTAWHDFLDSPVIRNDERIIEWLGSIQLLATGSVQNWLRDLTKEIRPAFKNIDTSVIPDEELYSKLESILSQVHGQ